MKAACLLTPSRPNVWWDERGRLAIGWGEITQKIAAAKNKPLPSHGGKRDPSEDDQGRDSTLKQDRSNDYTLRRLARDCPEILDRIESGELSVNAAAIQAGIRKVDTPDEKALKALRKADNPDEVWETFSAERCGLTA